MLNIKEWDVILAKYDWLIHLLQFIANLFVVLVYLFHTIQEIFRINTKHHSRKIFDL